MYTNPVHFQLLTQGKRFVRIALQTRLEQEVAVDEIRRRPQQSTNVGLVARVALDRLSEVGQNLLGRAGLVRPGLEVRDNVPLSEKATTRSG